MKTRSIHKISQVPSDWLSVIVDAKRFREDSWEYFSIRAFLNLTFSELIVEKLHEAADIEHYTREHEFKWIPCSSL